MGRAVGSVGNRAAGRNLVVTRRVHVSWPVAAGAAVVLLAAGFAVGRVTRGDDSAAVETTFRTPVPTAARPDVLTPAGSTTTASTTTVPFTAGPTTSGALRPEPSPLPLLVPAGPDDIGARICGSDGLRAGPATAADAGAIYPGKTVVTVPAGDNAKLFDAAQAGAVFWLAPGTHTLGSSEFGQIQARASDVYVGAPGAVLDGQGRNRGALSGNATDVTLAYLEVTGFVAPLNEGVINHDSADGWVIEHVYAHDNGGAAMMAGARQQVRYSCLANTGQYAFNAYQQAAGIVDVVFEHNEITGNNTGDWENKQKGCGCTGGGKFWDVKGARVTENWVHDNHSVGLWADTNNVDFLFARNIVEDNADVGIWYEISYNARISDNLIARNGWEGGRSDTGAPSPGIYLSEAGGDARLPSANAGAPRIDITRNRLVDNYSGITLYENANRFCNSNGNSSTSYCTPFVTDGVIAEPHDFTYGRPVNKSHPCNAPGIGTEPLYTDCRWRTQHVLVAENDFGFDRAKVPCGSEWCGVMALYVSGADNQSWQPYRVADVLRAVVSGQDNRWTANRYTGAWRFAVGYGDRVDWADWQATYAQDGASTLAA